MAVLVVLLVLVGVVLGVGVVMMVRLVRFDGLRLARASEMPVRTTVRMSVDVAPVPV